MTVKKRNLLILAGVVVALALAIVSMVTVKAEKQYSLIGDYVSTHASQTGPLGKQSRTKVVCGTADRSAGHCRAIQYAISGRQCIAISRDLLGSAHCQSGKDITFKGHTLHVTIGEMYPQTGNYLIVEYVR